MLNKIIYIVGGVLYNPYCSGASGIPEIRALVEDITTALHRAAREVNKIQDTVLRNATIANSVAELEDMISMVEGMVNRTWSQETTAIQDGFKFLMDRSWPDASNKISDNNTVSPTPAVHAKPALPATKPPTPTKDVSAKGSLVGGKNSPLFDDSRPRRTIKPLPILEIVLLLSGLCLALVGGHFCIKSRAAADRHVGYLSRLPRAGGGTLECEAHPTVDRFLAVFAYRRFVPYGQGAKLEIRLSGGNLPDIYRIFDIESLVRREGCIDQVDRAKLEDFLHSKNALEVVSIHKEVYWAALEDLKCRIIKKFRDDGIYGDVDIMIHDTPENILVRQNSTWARFIRDRTTMALMALSLIGLVWYLPYTWAKSKRRTVVARFEVKMSSDDYWRLIRDKVNEMSSEASRALSTSPTTAISSSCVDGPSEIDV
ncbi:hypothetical protein FOL47_005905 [Perkinsus chesapeaki]|uniref:Uncharacterized protein n=1 Tax=Perkinsus chesapeaki TaxID=330153 RepID=A0A7J6LVB5_PERCH|nr:hypothetical protein FOL47_005905 [Perkinsus chesapeaki]